jgi:threonine/homoserine/homoserine lactone efflux protein
VPRGQAAAYGSGVSDLLAQTVPLSLAAAISPLVMMGILAILAGPHPKVNGVAYTLGVVAMTAGLIAIGLAIVEHQKSKSGGGPVGSPWADAVIGTILILFAAQMMRPKHSTDRDKATDHRNRLIKQDSSPVAYFVLGAVLMVVNFSTIIVLMAILRNVAQAGQPAVNDVIAMTIVTVITTIPAWGPLVLVLAGGAAMSDRVTRLGQWTNHNAKYILGVLFIVFGLQDLLKAFGH